MPRARVVQKSSILENGINLVSSTTTLSNLSAPEIDPKKVTPSKERGASVKKAALGLTEKIVENNLTMKTSTGRRGVKKPAEDPKNEEVKKPTGRAKANGIKQTKATEEVINDELVGKALPKPKGRPNARAPTVQNHKIEDAEVATSSKETKKAIGKSLKKKELTPAPEVDVDATQQLKDQPAKRTARKRNVADQSKEIELEQLGKLEATLQQEEKTPVIKAKTVTKKQEKAAPTTEKPLAAKRERGRRAPTQDTEIVESPKKKSKLFDVSAKTVVEKKKRGAKVKQADIKEDEELKEEPTTSQILPAAAEKKSRGRKRAATADSAQNDVADDSKGEQASSSSPSKPKKKALVNATQTVYSKDAFELPPLEINDDVRYNLKISSWNVAGLRSWLKKDGLTFLDYEKPDIFCMQEIKCTTDQLPEEARIPGYHPYWLCMPGGYAGVAIYSKIMPINVDYGIGNAKFDEVGRIITAEYEKFYLINVYVPNSGRKLVNLESRMEWEKIFQEFIQKLDAKKPVIICGDMNVSHQEIDLANPKSNTRSAGFTKEERDKMTELLNLGYVDTFRHLYPQRKGAYTYWTYMANARSRNIGWRLDYFIVSERSIKRVVDNCIRDQCLGSDHCPITLFMKL